MAGFEIGNPLVTRAVIKIFTGSDMVTIGVANIPSFVLALMPSRSCSR